MAICSSACKRLPPQPPSAKCTQSLRSGGISRIVFAACNVIFDNIADPAEWCDKVNRGLIVASGKLVAQKPKGSPVNKRVDSCTGEQAVGFERTITFMDYNADNVDFEDYDFWAEYVSHPQFYQFGWLTCSGHFTGFFPSFTTEIDQVIEEASTGSSMWDGSIKWNALTLPKPIYIVNHENILAGNCTGVAGFSPCPPSTIEPISVDGTNVLTTPDGILLEVDYYINTLYQWYKDGNPIPGATDYQYVVNPSVWVTGDAVYTVKVTHTGCTAVTSVTGVSITDNRAYFNSAATPFPLVFANGSLTLDTDPITNLTGDTADITAANLGNTGNAQVFQFKVVLNGNVLQDWSLNKVITNPAVKVTAVSTPQKYHYYDVYIRNSVGAESVLHYRQNVA